MIGDEVLDAYRDGVQHLIFDQALNTHAAQPAKQLELILELIVGRISSDFTAPRLLECYRKFMDAMEWTAELSMDELGQRYQAACSQYYEPFLREHSHILEHYLVSYVHRTLFPLGPQQNSRGLSVPQMASTIGDQCLLILVHYGIIQTLLIGMAAFHKTEFGTAHAARRDDRRDFWEICEDRCQTRSLVLTSQMPVAKWHSQIGDSTVAEGILDRIIHCAHRIEPRGESMRKNPPKEPDR